MNLVALSLDTLGKVLVAYTALRVHHRVLHDHKLDEQVFADMKKEQYAGLLGVVLILASFALKAYLELT